MFGLYLLWNLRVEEGGSSVLMVDEPWLTTPVPLSATLVILRGEAFMAHVPC